jgi:hypothetical protein
LSIEEFIIIILFKHYTIDLIQQEFNIIDKKSLFLTNLDRNGSNSLKRLAWGLERGKAYIARPKRSEGHVIARRLQSKSV